MAYIKNFDYDPVRRYFVGLSTDTLPTDCAVGDLLLQTDLRKEWIYSTTGAWVLKQKFST